ncbi:MAG: hypothetical protein ACJZ40_06265 [Candidatus Poseidoniaceae archaeon]
MPIWQPTEDDTDLLYIIAASLCWTASLWSKLFIDRVVAPIHQWKWLTLLLTS